MTSHNAFGGDSRLKSNLIDRLAAHFAAGDVRFDRPAWDGTAGTPAGCTVHHADPMVFAAQTGYPVALVLLLDFLYSHEQGHGPAAEARGKAVAMEWLAAATVGGDLSKVPSAIVLEFLHSGKGLCHDIETSDPQICAAWRQAVALHERVIHDAPPEKSTWTAARRLAIAAADQASSDVGRCVGTLVETVCWNPLVSRTLLTDAFRPWVRLRQSGVTAALGWRAKDSSDAEATLQALWIATSAEREAGVRISYPDLFAQQNPDLARRFAEQLNACNAAALSAVEDYGQIALRHLRQAKVPEANGDARAVNLAS